LDWLDVIFVVVVLLAGPAAMSAPVVYDYRRRTLQRGARLQNRRLPSISGHEYMLIRTRVVVQSVKTQIATRSQPVRAADAMRTLVSEARGMVLTQPNEVASTMCIGTAVEPPAWAYLLGSGLKEAGTIRDLDVPAGRFLRLTIPRRGCMHPAIPGESAMVLNFIQHHCKCDPTGPTAARTDSIDGSGIRPCRQSGPSEASAFFSTPFGDMIGAYS